jgi:peptide/nickel transport system substrate-binding protein
MKRVARPWRIVVLVCVLGMVAAACGDDGGSSSSSSSTPSASGSSGTAPGSSTTLTPQKGGTITISEFSAAGGLDPTKIGNSGTTGGNTALAIYDTLMMYNTTTQKYEGRTAQSLVPNADFTQWTLKLKPGIKFNDGTDYNSEAVRFSIDRESKEGTAGPRSQLQQFVDTMTVVDPLTLTFKLKLGWAGFPSLLTGLPGVVYSPTQFAKVGDPTKFNLDPGPANAGPFNVKSYKPGESLELVRNPNYWGGDVYLDGIKFVVLGAATTSLEALKANSIQAALLLDAAVIKKALDAGMQKNAAVATPGNVIAMNVGDVPCKGGQPAVCAGKPDGEVAKVKTATSDIRVRKAVVAAVDPNVINTRAYEGASSPSSAFFAGNPWDPKVPGPKYDPDTAKKLVTEAKAGGWDGKIRVLAANTAEGQAWAQAVATQLAAVGMTPDVDTTKTTAVIVPQVQLQRDYDLATFAYAVLGDADSAYPGLVAAFNSKDKRYGYGNAEMDAAMDLMRVADTDAKRTEAFKQFTEIFNRDAPGAIITPLDYALVYTSKLQGVQRTAQAEFHFDKAWLKP